MERNLGLIKEQSAVGCDCTKRMEARWAEEFYNGAYAKRRSDLDKCIREYKSPSSLGQGGYNNEGGANYYRLFEIYTMTAEWWYTMGAQGSSGAQSVYDALDKGLDEYWAVMRRTAEGLQGKDVKYWVGAIFIKIFEIQWVTFNTAIPYLIGATSAVDEEKREKVKEWLERTRTNIKAAMTAAGGSI